MIAAGLLACDVPGGSARSRSQVQEAPAPAPASEPRDEPVAPASATTTRPPLAVAAPPASLPASLPTGLRWLAIGGGATPEFNQVSIEQDLLLAQEVFGTGGAGLFAGGPGSHGVQVADPAPRGDPLLAELAELFAPRGGRRATYHPTRLAPLAAATPANALDLIRAALAEPGPPLLVYLAGHGERGEQPQFGAISLWGQDILRVAQLAEVLDAAQRPAQIVATSCFSGSFGELVFKKADPREGPAATIRCGLFAATAERESSGCDPNPDRAAQDGFGLHFLQALRGQDRTGAPLPREAIDFDGDGAISPLEAHARARIAGEGIDVPTTTSERWLRAVAPAKGRAAELRLPEEEAVIAGLAPALGLTGREREAPGELEALWKDMDAAYGRLDQATRREDDAYRTTAAELLARFPVLDDPWHPDFAPTIAAHRDAIAAALAGSAAYAEFRAAGAAVQAAQDEVAELLARSARIERLVRAIETRALAGRLKARGGAAWRTYEALLACERTRNVP